MPEIPAYEETRDIAGIIEPGYRLSRESLELAAWISCSSLCPLFEAVSLMLPPGYDRKAVTYIRLTVSEDIDDSTLTDEQSVFLAFLRRSSRTSLRVLDRQFGQKKVRSLVSWLVRNRYGVKEYRLEPVKVRPRTEARVRLSGGQQEAAEALAALRNNRRATNQTAFLEYLIEQDAPVMLSRALKESGCSRATVTALQKKGTVTFEQVTVRRDPLAAHPVNISYPLTMTAGQQQVFDEICDGLRRAEKGRPSIFLLHGVTGSGKTEVYLQSLAEAIQQGKRGIVLVPEIALTPQTIERFASRFPGRVAVLHSQLSLGERFDEWQRIMRGDADVVIGPRSAIFAPQPDLGLIILDEEHEWTYKQQDSPRYHAREVAVRLAELKGAAVVLGSATPDIESYHHTETGDYHLLELPGRVTPYENAPMPKVEIVDLRAELKSGNRSMFSRLLAAAVRRALAGNEQVMLFLNRRGGATCIQCRDCGFVIKCRRCDVPLTYHLADNLLVCHQCNHRSAVPGICPQCGSRRIRFLGAGTQKLEQETAAVFPGARLLRWDSDTTGKRDAHREIMEKFRNHEADILIGTQMITKGLDLPLVTLVGVVNADTALNLPDFRSGERTFQLLSQVAGRAGRGPLGGQVIIQTYSPDHYAVQAASRHDYGSLYRREIEYRKELHYPPFSRLASLVYSHSNEDAGLKEAQRQKAALAAAIDTLGISGIRLIGPAPAFVHRLRGRYRWQIMVRGHDLSEFLSDVPFAQGWVIDIDPVGL
jgi:primosomal protein N' (replication factor Y)